MTPAEVKRHLTKVLKDNAELSFDVGCANIADVALGLRESGQITSLVISTRSDDDRVTCVDVGLPNGELLEVEIS